MIYAKLVEMGWNITEWSCSGEWQTNENNEEQGGRPVSKEILRKIYLETR